MGCDIHMLTEYKKTVNNKEQWVNVDHFSYNPYYNKEKPDGETEMELEPIYSSRDYGLFNRLAGVRGYGDKTVKTFAEKGIPDDVSEVTKKIIDYWSSDGHSHSYLTYKEWEDYTRTDGWDSISCKNLLEKMKERLCDVSWTFNGELKEETKEKFRIVFFFDN